MLFRSHFEALLFRKRKGGGKEVVKDETEINRVRGKERENKRERGRERWGEYKGDGREGEREICPGLIACESIFYCVRRVRVMC